ncbi:MAG: hypothetical protein WCG84_03590 [Candidatus Moraniibacteriota bacterium]
MTKQEIIAFLNNEDGTVSEEVIEEIISEMCKKIERATMLVSFSEELEANLEGWKLSEAKYAIVRTSNLKPLAVLTKREPLTLAFLLKILHDDTSIESGAIFWTSQGPVEVIKMNDKHWFAGKRDSDPVLQGTQIIFAAPEPAPEPDSQEV